MPRQVISLENIDSKIAAAEERLNLLIAQKEKLIVQEKAFISIGQLVCESLNCDYDDISFDALREYMSAHKEEINIISGSMNNSENFSEENFQ